MRKLYEAAAPQWRVLHRSRLYLCSVAPFNQPPLPLLMRTLKKTFCLAIQKFGPQKENIKSHYSFYSRWLGLLKIQLSQNLCEFLCNWFKSTPVHRRIPIILLETPVITDLIMIIWNVPGFCRTVPVRTLNMAFRWFSQRFWFLT